MMTATTRRPDLATLARRWNRVDPIHRDDASEAARDTVVDRVAAVDVDALYQSERDPDPYRACMWPD